MSAIKRIIALALCAALCFGCVSITASAARDVSFETGLAEDLNALNLFKGTGTGFDLESPLKRQDAVIMLLRLLGQIDDAKAYSKTHPFTDVPAYADLYISYAKDNALAYGTGDTTFGVTDTTTQQFLTFVLRALGYSDKGGKDFTYANPYDLAQTVGILPDSVDLDNFLRADVVLICYAALAADMADGSGTLAEKLIAEGLFTQEAFDANYDPNAFTAAPEKTVLNSEEVYAKCSSSVFYIEVYDASGVPFATGSGFFIDEYGTAVTNYHVIDGASSARITLTNGEVYNVAGVYDCDAGNDWAVLQIEGESFDYLTIGDKSTVVGGAMVYALGSPLGLQDTFTDGMISNANRVQDGVSYIQISAPISSGSSGGALINKYGEVIGICSAGYVEGQNLNLALPITCIEGYSRDGIYLLSDLFPADTGSADIDTDTGASERQQLAYDVLMELLYEMYNYTESDGSPVYYEEVQNGIYYYLTHYLGTDYLELCACYSISGIDVWTFMYVTATGNAVDVYTYVSDTYDPNLEYFYGESYLTTPYTTSALSYDFYEIYDDSIMISDMELLGSSMMDLTLVITDLIFSYALEYSLPLCSMEDFGFTYN